MSPLGQGNLADLKEAEIWEGFPEEEAFLRVKLGIAKGPGVGEDTVHLVSLSNSWTSDKAPSLSPHPGPDLCERSGQGAQEPSKAGCWA